jgi:erythromycin esterase-like protein
MSVRPALPGSVEHLFHEVGIRNFLLELSTPTVAATGLRIPRLERAIGVIYRPATERQSHYFQASLSEQFDAVLHYDTTRAVQPMEHEAPRLPWAANEAPETYPAAL